jgi:hypothetical protein
LNADPHPLDRKCAVPTFRCQLRVLLAAAAVAMPVSSTVAKPAAPAGRCLPATQTTSTRFSELAELTPTNVRGLMPLVARTAAVALREARLAGQRARQRGLQVDTATSVDERLQRFLEERVQSEPAMQHRGHAQPDGGSLSTGIGYVPGSSELRAWDPERQRVLWSVRDALPGASRTLVTAGGLVFYGTCDGWLKALDARTGRELWKRTIPEGRLEEASSYRGPDGHQYIAVRTLPGNRRGEREALLVFALPQ